MNFTPTTYWGVHRLARNANYLFFGTQKRIFKKVAFYFVIASVTTIAVACVKGYQVSKSSTQNTSNTAPYYSHLSSIFAESVFDYFTDHNQALDVFLTARNNQLISDKPAVLVHVDSHCDYYDNEYLYDDIGNFIHQLMINNDVAEVYWIKPPHLKGKNNTSGVRIVDKKSKRVLPAKPVDFNSSPDRYRNIPIHEIQIIDLPGNLGDDGRPIVLDIDADFFADANGNDEQGKVLHEDDLLDFVKQLNEKNIRPALTLGAMSPVWTTSSAAPALERFFQDIGANSKTNGDLIAGYDHQHAVIDDNYNGIRKRGLPIIQRSRDPDLQATYAMRFQDFHQQEGPDHKTPIDDPGNAEYQQVIAKLCNIYRTNENEVGQKLVSWDLKDGTPDNFVNYVEIEKNLLSLAQSSTRTPLPATTGTSTSSRLHLD
jgi:hypothetical protein